MKIKGKRSFSEVIRDLIRKEGNFYLLLIASGTRNYEDVEELKREIGEAENLIRV